MNPQMHDHPRPRRQRVAAAASMIAPILCAWIIAMPVGAGSPDEEIHSLIDAVAASGCLFMRNGKTYNADKAADHLRLKYRRGRKYAGSAELFIERLASKSSISRKPYYMECGDQERIETGQWLKRALSSIRTE